MRSLQRVQRYRLLTAPVTALPDFIIGAQRCGTSSLYNYLLSHPRVLPGTRKEIHYFDLNHDKGLNWYRSHFPRS